MRNVIALLCTECCSLIPPCLPILQVVAAAGCYLAVGFRLREIRLEDDLRRAALVPSSICKNLCKTSFVFSSLLKRFSCKSIPYMYIIVLRATKLFFLNLNFVSPFP